MHESLLTEVMSPESRLCAGPVLSISPEGRAPKALKHREGERFAQGPPATGWQRQNSAQVYFTPKVNLYMTGAENPG